MIGIYRIAEKNIQIKSLYNSVHEYCRDYRSSGQPDFTVEITQQDIDNESIRSARNDIAEGLSIRKWPEDYLEELAVYRKIAEKMIGYDTFLFHGSAVAVDGQAYLFTANSGTGKSTHTRLWRRLLGDRAVMVNDDKPLIKVTGNGVTVFGTPYNGKHRIGNDIAVPLRAICVLERAEENSIRQISKSEVFAMLIQQTYRPDDKLLLLKTLTLINNMADQISFWHLGCNMDISAAKIAYEAMK